MPTSGDDPVGVERPTLAKIVATVGPASEHADAARRMIEAGVSVFRLNFSHGSLEDHARRLGAVREAARAVGRPIAVLGDLCGPKIRVGRIEGVDLEPGQEVDLVAGEEGGGAGGCVTLPVTYPELAREVEPGHRVLINDGAIRMLATERRGAALRCVVRVGGAVSSGKGVNLPDSRITAPALTRTDTACVRWALEHELDFLALSFVRRAEDVLELKERLASLAVGGGGVEPMPVVAKIEKPQAVASLDEIIEASDAIMVARGDLGVEMDIAQVPVVQKRILARCQAWGRPCIVATQMLESMIEKTMPTRAEASDVAGAVLDGTDAVMLSGETAVGRHPALVVETMRRIVAAAEAHVASLPHEDSAPGMLVESRYRTAALAHGAWHVARDVGARLVVCWSQQGGTARYLSQNGFRVPIIAYSSSERSARRMALLGGVTPMRADPPTSGRLSAWTDMVERDLLARGWARRGEPVVLLAGKPLGQVRATNSIAILYVGDPTSGYRAHGS